MSYWYDDTMHYSARMLPFDAGAGYHTYSIRWRPESIEWLVDGTPVRQVCRRCSRAARGSAGPWPAAARPSARAQHTRERM